MLAEPQASAQRLTDDPGEDWGPRWTPDGQRIVFYAHRTGSFHIFVMDNDGSNVIQLTEGGFNDIKPDVSPDGTQIVFVANRGGRGIFVVNIDGTNLTQLTNGDGSLDTPRWSPDGSTIAFARSGDIWVMNADGSGQSQVFHDPRSAALPVWSPDGTQIAYVTDRDTRPGGSGHQIYVTTLDGGVHVKIADVDANRAFDWSPNGDRLVFDKGRELYELDLAKGTTEQLTFNPAADLEPAYTR